MANPQKENGYTAIANETMRALARIRISGEARQVLDVIFYQTYGYNKKEDAIALSQFCEKTGMHKWSICKALSKLRSMNIITQKGNDIANTYRFNKDFDTWKSLPKKQPITQKGNERYPKRQSSLPKRCPTKATITKTTITKASECGRFAPPTLTDVVNYCTERANTVNAERFVDFYTSKGWMVGKNKMKDWRAAVRNWEKPQNQQQIRKTNVTIV